MSEELALMSIKNQFAYYRLEIDVLKQKLKDSENRNVLYKKEINQLKQQLIDERKGEQC